MLRFFYLSETLELFHLKGEKDVLEVFWNKKSPVSSNSVQLLCTRYLGTLLVLIFY